MRPARAWRPWPWGWPAGSIACPTPEPTARRPNSNRCWRGAGRKRSPIAGAIRDRRDGIGHAGFRPVRRRRVGRAAGRSGGHIAACWSFWPPPAASSIEQHAELAQLLLEPFSVALENDLRLREMAALREAAEADKRSLLTRLGRKTLGDTIVGVESGLRAVMERVELVARSDAPVLIFGETGTGKELVARAIHNRSRAPPGPVRSRQLRGDSAGADRFATVRPRAGRVHRGGRSPPRLVRAGRRRHAVSRRDRRVAAGGPGPHVAHLAGRLDGTRRRREADQRRRADHRRHAPRPGRRWWPKGGSARTCGIGSPYFPIVLPPLRERREDIAQLAAAFRRAGGHAVRVGAGRRPRRRTWRC